MQPPATVTPLTPAEEERHFPDITAMEEAFVWQLLANGGKLKQAAIKAGYAKTSAAVSASRISRKPQVVRALKEAAVIAMGGHIPAALAKLAKLGLSAKSEHVQLSASQDILDRVGLSAPKQVRLGGALSVTFDLGDD